MTMVFAEIRGFELIILRDAGTGVHYGGTSPLTFERGGQRGHRCPYNNIFHR